MEAVDHLPPGKRLHSGKPGSILFHLALFFCKIGYCSFHFIEWNRRLSPPSGKHDPAEG